MYVLCVYANLRPLCELVQILEEEGVFGNAQFLELPLHLTCIDSDVASFHLPSFFKDFFVHGDQTALPWIARGLRRVLTAAGGFAPIVGAGTCAHMISELMVLCASEDIGGGQGRQGRVEGQARQRAFTAVVLLDRLVDLVSIGLPPPSQRR